MKKLPITMSKKEYVEIIKITKQLHHKIAYMLGFESGLRISEILALTPEMFNFEEGTIRIEDGSSINKRGKDNEIKDD